MEEEKQRDVIIIGSKIDETENRKISFEQGFKFATKNNLGFFEVSAKDWESYDGLLDYLSTLVVRK